MSTVIMLRDVEELSTAETAAALDLTEQNVKVRLHRGRAMMRDRLFAVSEQAGNMHFRSWVAAVTVWSSAFLHDLKN